MWFDRRFFQNYTHSMALLANLFRDIIFAFNDGHPIGRAEIHKWPYASIRSPYFGCSLCFEEWRGREVGGRVYHVNNGRTGFPWMNMVCTSTSWLKRRELVQIVILKKSWWLFIGDLHSLHDLPIYVSAFPVCFSKLGLLLRLSIPSVVSMEWCPKPLWSRINSHSV